VLETLNIFMTTKKRKKEISPELIIETHPSDYDGAPWATLIQYVGKYHLVVVNTLEPDYLWGYSIESMSNEECDVFCIIMDQYWEATLYNDPLRNHIAPDQWITERNLSSIFGRVMTAYSTENIVRVIGPVRYAVPAPPKQRIRRRKRVDVDKNLIKKS